MVCYQALAHRMGRERPFYGIRSRGLHGEEVLPAGWRTWPRSTWPRCARFSRKDLTSSAAGPPEASSPWRWPSSSWIRASKSTCWPCSTRPRPRTPAALAEQDASTREYGLDLSLEELARLGPDEQLPYLWQHALKLGLVEPGVPLQVAEQVLDELKRLFHPHMVLANDIRVRPYPGR